jgi:tetratricopeptide (TPR) repeat protein
MVAEHTQPIEIFYSYAHADEKLRDELNKHLYNLKRQGFIVDWYDRDISAGTEWKHQIDSHLNTAQIILLLISPDFLASEYCYSIEMTRALERHEAGDARVIPIMLKSVDWHGAPFKKLQMLPKNAKAVTSWRNRSDAFVDIAKGIREVAKELKPAASSNASSPDKSQQETPLPPVDVSFTMSIEEEQQNANHDPIWYVPYKRNQFFTSREEILQDLRATFMKSKPSDATTIRVLSGLGGIGKTQVAIEYAYRHREDYHTVFWVRADSLETLFADFVYFADLLQLPGRQRQEQKYTLNAVKYWLETNTSWLLILDNVEDLRMVHEYLPSTPRGHILLTTRTQVAGGIATRQEIEKMEPEEGALLLLRRASLIAPGESLATVPQTERMHPIAIANLLDGLPLAIDQAAAYIEETGATLSSFIEIYDKRRAKLLNERGGVQPDHPEPVSTTWSLAFERVELANPAAAELLRLFAFLHPDAIADELIRKGAPHLGAALEATANDAYELNRAIGELRKYSLVRRNPDGTTLSLHRLVQAVLIDAMDEQTQRQWAERTVLAVNEAFPAVDFTLWQDCQRYLPHAQRCFALIQQWSMTFPEAAELLNKVGRFLEENGQYTEAAPFLELALAIREQTLGPEHLAVAESLNNLAELYRHQGKYNEIEPLYQRALAIREQALGPMHPDVATSLNNLARPYHHQYQFDKAFPLYQRALTIREQILGPMHPDVADTLNDLGLLYNALGQYSEARSLLERALAIREQVLGPMHPDTANSLVNLSSLYERMDQYSEARPLLERALVIHEQVLGFQHPDTAYSLTHLGSLYGTLGRFIEARPLLERALTIREQALGPKHPHTADCLINLSYLYTDQSRFIEARPLLERALAIYEQILGPKHPDTARSLAHLGSLYANQRN